ncbi:hypothetical protein HDU87_000558 [Geranomyces variabilis]|uniref:Uncharacterized protein n=1 Tax=Geranomyces variabilis TaxID=109894 RepID=A0AAD5TEL1_9FUNG|nr:hypothetical protein HDU87_000558 [Geranomyces variabilis]
MQAPKEIQRATAWSVGRRLVGRLACIAVLCGLASAATPLPGAPHTIDYLKSPICAGPADSAWSTGRDQLALSAQCITNNVIVHAWHKTELTFGLPVAASDVIQFDMARLSACDPDKDRTLEISQQVGAYIGNTRQARNLLCAVTDRSIPPTDTQLQSFTGFVAGVAAAESQLQTLLQGARQDPQCQAWGLSQSAPSS